MPERKVRHVLGFTGIYLWWVHPLGLTGVALVGVARGVIDGNAGWIAVFGFAAALTSSLTALLYYRGCRPVLRDRRQVNIPMPGGRRAYDPTNSNGTG